METAMGSGAPDNPFPKTELGLSNYLDEFVAVNTGHGCRGPAVRSLLCPRFTEVEVRVRALQNGKKILRFIDFKYKAENPS